MVNDIGGRGAAEEWDKGWDDAITESIRLLDRIPAARMVPDHRGIWVHDDLTRYYACSECLMEVSSKYAEDWLCCPSCGAKMTADQEHRKEGSHEIQ